MATLNIAEIDGDLRSRVAVVAGGGGGLGGTLGGGRTATHAARTRQDLPAVARKKANRFYQDSAYKSFHLAGKNIKIL